MPVNATKSTLYLRISDRLLQHLQATRWRQLILIFLSCINFSCEREVISKFIYPSSIITGQIVGDSIIYVHLDTNIIIESSYDTNFYNLDINNDSIIDFIFSNYEQVSSGYRYFLGRIYPQNENNIVVSDSNKSWIDTIGINTSVNNKLLWSNNISWLYKRIFAGSGSDTWLDEYGLWKNVNDKYIGIMLNKEGKIYYGWIKIKTELSWNVDYIIEIESFAMTKPVPF